MDPGCSSGVRSYDRLLIDNHAEGIKPPTWAIDLHCLCNDVVFICFLLSFAHALF
jgi:hypothetical protein